MEDWISIHQLDFVILAAYWEQDPHWLHPRWPARDYAMMVFPFLMSYFVGFTCPLRNFTSLWIYVNTVINYDWRWQPDERHHNWKNIPASDGPRSWARKVEIHPEPELFKISWELKGYFWDVQYPISRQILGLLVRNSSASFSKASNSRNESSVNCWGD